MTTPVSFLAQLNVTLEVDADGKVRLVIPNDPGDVLEFVNGAFVGDGEYLDIHSGWADQAPTPEEDAAIVEALELAEQAIAAGECPVVVRGGFSAPQGSA